MCLSFPWKADLSVNQSNNEIRETVTQSVTDRASSEWGSYILELGVVLVGVVAVVLGGADVARIIQGRGAVRAGVEEGLRCLTTTDDPNGCRNPVTPGGQFTIPPRFDVRAAGFEIPYRQIEVSATWETEPVLDLPTETFPGGDVTVQYSVPRRRLAQQEVLFPVEARSEYLLEVSAPPFLAGTPLNPSVRSLRNRAQVIAPREVVDINAERFRLGGAAQDVSTDPYDPRWALLETTSFTVSAFGGSDPASSISNLALARARGAAISCYQPPDNSASSAILGSGSATRFDWTRTPVSCVSPANGTTSLYTADTLSVPVALRITGAGFTDTVGTEGQLVVRMEWNEGGRRRRVDLGGRTFAGSGSNRGNNQTSSTVRANDDGTLVMRGVVAANMSSDLREQYRGRYEEEVRLHGDLPLIPSDTTVTLQFFLRKIAGPDSASVSWRGERVQVYYPQYQFVDQRLYSDEEPIPTQCSMSEEELRKEGLQHLINAPVTRCVTGEPRMATISESPCEDSPIRDAVVIERNPTARLAAARDRAFNSPTLYTQPERFMVAEEGAPVCPERRVRSTCQNSQSVTVIGKCEASENSNGGVVGCQPAENIPENAKKITYSRSRGTQPESQGSILVGVCSVEAFPACALEGVVPTRSRPYDPAPGKPECSAVTRSLPLLGRYPASPEPMSDADCEARLNDAKADAQLREKIPQSATIVSTCLSPEWRFSLHKPTNPDTPFRETADGTYRTAGTRLSATQADAICAAAGGRCEKQRLATRDVSTGGGGVSDGSGAVNTPQVSSVVYDTIQAAYPRAVPCSVGVASTKDCVAISVNQTGTGSGASARVRAQLTLPLSFLSLLVPDVGVVEYEDARLTEAALSLK
jgi:hypothetical protein